MQDTYFESFYVRIVFAYMKSFLVISFSLYYIRNIHLYGYLRPITVFLSIREIFRFKRYVNV